MSKEISQMPDGGNIQSNDLFVIARGNGNFSILGQKINTGGGSGNIIPIRTISSGASDTATITDGVIGWKSTVASGKAQSIPVPTTLGLQLTIKDVQGTSATFPITITPVSGTIDGAANYILSVNKGSVTMVADGTSNYVVM